jgi:hypothetical protein
MTSGHVRVNLLDHFVNLVHGEPLLGIDVDKGEANFSLLLFLFFTLCDWLRRSAASQTFQGIPMNWIRD